MGERAKRGAGMQQTLGGRRQDGTVEVDMERADKVLPLLKQLLGISTDGEG